MHDLEGRPCTVEELQVLSGWVRRQVHLGARIRRAVWRMDGYLVEVEVPGFTSPQWYGVALDELQHARLVSAQASSL